MAVGRGRSGEFLDKISIFNAFEEGIKQSHVVRHFGDNFLNMLDRGIYLSPRYVYELKVSEYSRKFSKKIYISSIDFIFIFTARHSVISV